MWLIDSLLKFGTVDKDQNHFSQVYWQMEDTVQNPGVFKI